MSNAVLLTNDAERSAWRVYYGAAVTGVLVGRAQAEPMEVARMCGDFADALVEEERRRHPRESDWDGRSEAGSGAR